MDKKEIEAYRLKSLATLPSIKVSGGPPRIIMAVISEDEAKKEAELRTIHYQNVKKQLTKIAQRLPGHYSEITTLRSRDSCITNVTKGTMRSTFQSDMPIRVLAITQEMLSLCVEKENAALFKGKLVLAAIQKYFFPSKNSAIEESDAKGDEQAEPMQTEEKSLADRIAELERKQVEAKDKQLAAQAALDTIRNEQEAATMADIEDKERSTQLEKENAAAACAQAQSDKQAKEFERERADDDQKLRELHAQIARRDLDRIRAETIAKEERKLRDAEKLNRANEEDKLQERQRERSIKDRHLRKQKEKLEKEERQWAEKEERLRQRKVEEEERLRKAEQHRKEEEERQRKEEEVAQQHRKEEEERLCIEAELARRRKAEEEERQRIEAEEQQLQHLRRIREEAAKQLHQADEALRAIEANRITRLASPPKQATPQPEDYPLETANTLKRNASKADLEQQGNAKKAKFGDTNEIMMSAIETEGVLDDIETPMADEMSEGDWMGPYDFVNESPLLQMGHQMPTSNNLLYFSSISPSTPLAGRSTPHPELQFDHGPMWTCAGDQEINKTNGM